MAEDSESGDWTPDLSNLNSTDRTVQLTELRRVLSHRLAMSSGTETVALSKELDRVSVLLASITPEAKDGVEDARQGYNAKVGGAGTTRGHLSAVRDDGGR